MDTFFVKLFRRNIVESGVKHHKPSFNQGGCTSIFQGIFGIPDFIIDF
jgi:hypothetical protein